MFSYVLNLYKNHEYDKVLQYSGSTEEKILELQGLAALKINKDIDAFEIFKKLMVLNNLKINIYHAALALMKLKEYKKAIKYFDECKSEIKLSITSRVNMSHCLLELKEIEQATQLLYQIIKENPKIKPAWYMLLNTYRKLNQIEELKKICSLANNYVGDSIEYHKSIVTILFNKKEFNKIIKLYLETIYFKDELIKSYVAKSYLKLSQFNKSVKIYTLILNENKSYINFFNLAAAYSNLTAEKDLMYAIKYSLKCLQTNKNYHQAHHCMALSWKKLTILEKALICINKAILIDRNNQDYLYIKATIYKELGNKNESLKTLKIILNQNPNYNKALRLKGIVKLQLNKLKSSEKNLVKAIEIDNTDQRAIAYYAIAKMAQNKQDEVNEFLALGHFVKEFKFDRIEGYDNLEEFNRAFEKDIKNHSLLRKEPNGLAARNGYLTDNIFADNAKSINSFKNTLLKKIYQYIDELPNNLKHHMLRHKTKEFKISSWATWVHGDGFIDKHIHEDSWISGAYYCKVPKITDSTKQNEGYFEYGCIPNDIDIIIEKKRGYIKPVEGKLVIFPSYLYHQTIPHITDEDRISIAFDLTPKSWQK